MSADYDFSSSALTQHGLTVEPPAEISQWQREFYNSCVQGTINSWLATLGRQVPHPDYVGVIYVEKDLSEAEKGAIRMFERCGWRVSVHIDSSEQRVSKTQLTFDRADRY
jgi:hypothetical protein